MSPSRQIPRRIERNSVNKSEHKSGATRTASRPRQVGSAYPTIRDGAPESYASSQVITAYLTTMRRRAALLARTGQRGSLYVSVPSHLRRSPAWPRLWAALRHGMRPAEVRTFTDLWGTGPGHIERYLTGWEDHADTLTGLVVVIGQTGAVGRGVVREIESARLRGLPILVRTASRYVPLIDCRTTSYLKPWPTMQIDLPTSVPGRATLVACFAAMGAVR